MRSSKIGMGRETSSTVTIRLANKEISEINKICKKSDIPKSVFIRDAVISKINNQ
jgi:hypothetical protein